MTAKVEVRRGPGRPRSLEADHAIHAAALAVFADSGFEGMNIGRVASRAGVGKATIYRRYANKFDLLIAASAHFVEEREPVPDSGSAAADIREVIDRLVAVLTESPVGAAFPMMLAERKRIPELAAAYTEVLTPKRQRNRAIIRLGIERGQLRADCDPARVLDAAVSPVLYRFLVTDLPLDESFVIGVVDTVMRAFGA
jgi:AcrR family transcriptional regulator